MTPDVPSQALPRLEIITISASRAFVPVPLHLACLRKSCPISTTSDVFTHVEFVSNLIEQAYKLGDCCYRAVSYSLAQSVTSSGRSGTIGQPFPEDAALKERASNIAKQLIVESPSHQFYQSLARKAEASIRFWEKRWEEEFDEF